MGKRSLMDAFSAGVGLTNQTLGIVDSIKKEKADANIRNTVLQFQSDTNNFIRGLEQRNDYDNFEKDADAFLSQFNTNSQNSATSNYESLAYQNMMAESRVQLMNQVANASLKAQANDTLLKNQSSANLNQEMRNNGLITASELIQRNGSMYDSEYASGVTSQQDYWNKQILNTSNVYSTDIMQAGMAVIDQGGSITDAISAMESFDSSSYTCKVLDSGSANSDILASGQANYRDITDMINKDTLKSNAAKQVQTYYNTVIKQRQEDNETKLSGVYADLLSCPSSEISAYVQKGISMIKNDMKGNNLTANVRDEYMEKFTKLLDNLASDGGSSSAKQSIFTNLVNSNMDAYIAAAFRGDMDNLDAAKEAFIADTYDDLVKVGYTKERDEYLFDYSKQINGFLDSALKSNYLPEQFKGLVDNVEKMTKSILEQNNLYNEAEIGLQLGTTKAYVFDMLTDICYRNAEPAEVLKRAQNFVSTQYVKSLNLITADESGTAPGYKRSATKSTRDKLMAATILESSNPDIVFTPDDSSISVKGGKQEVWKPGTKEGLTNGLVQDQADVISEITGFSKDKISYNWEDKGNDVNSIAIFTAGSDKYKFVSEDGKNYQVKKLNSSTGEFDITAYDTAAVKAQEKAAKVEARQQVQAKENTSFAEVDNFVSSNDDKIISVLGNNTELSKAVGYSATEWINLPDNQKSMVLKQLKEEQPQKYNSFVNAVTGTKNNSTTNNNPWSVNFNLWGK